MKYLFLIFSTFLLILGCRSEKSESPKVKVVNEFKLSETTQEHLFRMYTAVASNPNAKELAFSNYVSPLKVVITDYKGRFIEEIGKEGRGPKEIQSARFFGFDNNSNLVILDKTGALFKHFNRETGEVNSYDYPVKQGIHVTSRNLQMCGNRWYLGIQMLDKSTEITVPTIGVFDTEFNLVDTLGGYDPFFKGRKGILQEPVVKVDCDDRRIYTAHAKVPYIQIYSMDENQRIGRSTNMPSSFKLSGQFIRMVTDPREMTRFLSEEQSTSLSISYTNKYIYHVFRNERNKYMRPRRFNNSDHFAAVYDKKSLEYLGEVKLPGAVLGFTKDGELIVLNNQRRFEMQLIRIETRL